MLRGLQKGNFHRKWTQMSANRVFVASGGEKGCCSELVEGFGFHAER